MNISLAPERIESLKAGILGAIATLGAVLLTTGLAQWITHTIAVSSEWSASLTPITAIHGAIALITGLLFGVTYRYIVRQDENPHLKSGAVLAFGLIRGLAQLHVPLTISLEAIAPAQVISESWVVGQNIAVFAIAQLILNWALQRTWIKPFGS